MSPPVVRFDGLEFAIDASMLRKPSRRKQLRNGVAVAAALALAWGAGQLLVLAAAAAAVLVLLAVVLPLAHLAFGKTLSSCTAGTFIPAVMAGVDARFGAVRAELLLRTLRGRVLDVGSGGGAYLKYAFAATAQPVTEVVALEPNVHCHDKLARTLAALGQGRGLPKSLPPTARRPLPRTRITAAFVEQHLAEEGAARYDFALLGNVLCEVPDQRSVLRALDALLVDGARVYFCEHVRYACWWKAALQDLVNPWWRTLSDGCNCNRDTLAAIRSSCPDWELVHWTFPQVPGPFEVGMAVVRRKEKKKT